MSRPQKSKKQNENNEPLEIQMLEFLVHLIVPERVREEFLGDLLARIFHRNILC